jgi:hypothetical protein
MTGSTSHRCRKPILVDLTLSVPGKRVDVPLTSSFQLRSGPECGGLGRVWCLLLHLAWIAVGICTIWSTPVHASVRQLSNNSHHDSFPQINSRGHIVWAGEWDVYLWDSNSARRLTHSRRNSRPQINDSGQVVWSGSTDGLDDEIFLWNGSTSRQLTDNLSPDLYPQINNRGQVTWLGGDWQVFLWDGAAVRQLSSRSIVNSEPKINNAGQVVWEGHDHVGYQVFLWDGAAVQTIYQSRSGAGQLQINDQGQVVWISYDESSHVSLFLWDGASVRQLTRDAISDRIRRSTTRAKWYGLQMGRSTGGMAAPSSA